MPIFASFSKRAQLAIKLARDAAAVHHQPCVGTLHLLLGLLQAGGDYPACLTDRVTVEAQGDLCVFRGVENKEN